MIKTVKNALHHHMACITTFHLKMGLQVKNSLSDFLIKASHNALVLMPFLLLYSLLNCAFIHFQTTLLLQYLFITIAVNTYYPINFGFFKEKCAYLASMLAL